LLTMSLPLICLCFSIALLSANALPFPENEAELEERFHLVEGDIVAPPLSNQRNAVRSSGQLWAGKTFVYDVSSVSPVLANNIHRVLNILQSRTCLTFKQRTNERDYVKYISGNGCWSHVGRRGRAQEVSLGFSCGTDAIIVHETIHAIGFWHEHSRPDRDQYLHVLLQNVRPADRHNFNVHSNTIMVRPFDFQSTMLYGPSLFSVNGQNTLVSKVPGKRVMNQWEKPSFSQGDIDAINTLYGC